MSLAIEAEKVTENQTKDNQEDQSQVKTYSIKIPKGLRPLLNDITKEVSRNHEGSIVFFKYFAENAIKKLNLNPVSI